MAAAGPITGFGTVHLNGLVFDTSGAAITIDGQSATQDDLRAGEYIQVKGHHDDTQNQDFADQIDFRGNVIGPVTAIDATAQTLIVLGQTVRVTEDTSFDDDISPASLAGITVGAFVEVSGMPLADGSLRATRIQGKMAGSALLQVIGTAASTDSAAKTLKINALVVDFSGATLVDFPATGPKDGDVVEATGYHVELRWSFERHASGVALGQGCRARRQRSGGSRWPDFPVCFRDRLRRSRSQSRPPPARRSSRAARRRPCTEC